MSFKGKCLGSNVIVMVIENKQLSDGGFDATFVSDKNQKWGKGIVVGVGEKLPLDKNGIPYIKTEDIVIFDTNKATPYLEDALEYSAMDYNALLKVF